MSIYIDSELSEQLPGAWEEIIRDVIQKACEFLKCPYEPEVNVLITDNTGIQEINLSQREIDSPTDVLSFPALTFSMPGNVSEIETFEDACFDLDTGDLILGDIVLNMDRVKSQAEEYGHSIRRELAFLTAHSMLHLFGYDHMEDAEREEMESLQREMLEQAGYSRDA